MASTATILNNAYKAGIAIPAFNVPYLPMIKPIISAIIDFDSFAFIEVARIEWQKFECRGPAAVAEEFAKWEHSSHVRLHLDHIPVIDEDGQHVDYLSIIQDAIRFGYHSVMVDGSSLDLEGNIESSRQAVMLAHEAGIPCEAELGAIAREGSGASIPYEELFTSGLGFTNVEEAKRFVSETHCDWLSVAIGSIHGAVFGALKDGKKTEARLNIKHLDSLRKAINIPLVLHGGSGVKRDSMLAAVSHGITKINVGFEIRRAYEAALQNTGGDIQAARDAVYIRMVYLLKNYFNVVGTNPIITEGQS